MKANSIIRSEALAVLRGNWGSAVLLCLVYTILVGIVGAVGSSIMVPIIAWFVQPVLAIGLCLAFLGLIRDGKRLELNSLFSAFNKTYYWKSIGVMLLSFLYTFLWTLLLIIPGIIKSLSYSLAMYIVADEPEIGYDEAIEKSMAMMDGHKMQLFLMTLHFLLIGLLCVLTLGIGFLWGVPYMQAVTANFYLAVRDKQQVEA